MAFLTQAAVEGGINYCTDRLSSVSGILAKRMEDDIQSAEQIEMQLYRALNINGSSPKECLEELNRRIQQIKQVDAILGSNTSIFSGEDMNQQIVLPILRKLRSKKKYSLDPNFVKLFNTRMREAAGISQATDYASFLADSFNTVNKKFNFSKSNFSASNFSSGLTEMANGIISFNLETLKANQYAAAREVLLMWEKNSDQPFNIDSGDSPTKGGQVSQSVFGNNIQTTIEWPTNAYDEASLGFMRESDWDRLYKQNPTLALEIRREVATSLQNFIRGKIGNIQNNAPLNQIISEVLSGELEDGKKLATIFSGRNTGNFLRGILGEIYGHYIFSVLTGNSKMATKWQAQELSGKGKQSHEDLIVGVIKSETGFGIQVKNYSSLNPKIHYASATGDNFESLAQYIPNFSLFQEAIYQAYEMFHFNIEYRRKGRTAVKEPNPDFSGTRAKIEEVKKLADEVLTFCAAGLMYLSTARQQVHTGNPGNSLTLISGARVESSSQILQNILSAVRSQSVNRFSIDTRWAGKKGSASTIIDYLNSTNNEDRKNLAQKISNQKIYLTSSYQF